MKIEKFSKIIFREHKTNNLYTLPLGAPRHNCRRNMDAELPVLRILHPKPCARKTYAILGYVLCAHGFAWKILNNVISAPIFCRQSSILSCNRKPYRPLVCEHTKIDTKPISGSLDQCHNLALILETPEIGAASIFTCTDTNIWDAFLFYIVILDWPQSLVRKSLILIPNHANMFVC